MKESITFYHIENQRNIPLFNFISFKNADISIDFIFCCQFFKFCDFLENELGYLEFSAMPKIDKTKFLKMFRNEYTVEKPSQFILRRRILTNCISIRAAVSKGKRGKKV